MIDEYDTTVDWQKYPGRICILPVGSTEQHSAHLPVGTDTHKVALFARMLGEDLQAAVLPALPYATCLEHSGFRGSVSLKPETLMQVIRDIAGEMERQSFRIMVLLNGHGGNHSLLPVARDINRADRPLKIILANYWEFSDPDLGRKSRSRGMDIHAGEWETSVTLALLPNAVRKNSSDTPDQAGAFLRQGDLTTFGTGHFNPEGALGYPTLADKKTGHAIIASIRKNMTAALKKRIAYLLAHPRYSGSGGVLVRPMTEDDIPDALELKTLAGWNQTEAEWRLFHALYAGGAFVAVQNGRVIGTAMRLDYNTKTAWLGMVLVHPDFRRIGVATKLLRSAVPDSRTVRLDATPEGREVYRKIGFKDEARVIRMICASAPKLDAIDAHVKRTPPSKFTTLLSLDREVYGADRSPVLRGLRRINPAGALHWQAIDRSIEGFCTIRKGANLWHVGPLYARHLAQAQAIAAKAWLTCGGRSVIMDVPAWQKDFLRFLEDVGFSPQRDFTRMRRGANRSPGRPNQQFAMAGPDIG